MSALTVFSRVMEASLGSGATGDEVAALLTLAIRSLSDEERREFSEQNRMVMDLIDETGDRDLAVAMMEEAYA